MIIKYRRKIKKTSKNRKQQLREVYLLVETQAQEIYSYAVWLSGNGRSAKKSIEKALDQVVNNINAEFKEKQIKSEFFKALEFQCKKEKQESIDRFDQESLDFDQSDVSVSFRKVLDKMPERYSEPLLMRILNCLSVSELANYFSVSESEVLMRLSAARRIVSVLVSLELSNIAPSLDQEVKNMPAKYINELLVDMNLNTQPVGNAI